MRIILYIAMQVAVLLLVSIIGSILLNLFGIQISGSDYTSLLIMCAVFGCAGSLVSLFMSKFMCKKSYGVRVITNPQTSEELFLVNTVAILCQKDGLKMPEVGIYNSPDPNAFATGASKDAALLAVSTGLLNSMSQSEVTGVLGHEISHIKNGDMVTMALLQGVLNTFVYFFSYVVTFAIINATRGNNNNDNRDVSFGSSMMFYTINSLMQMVFGIGATMILMWFSRWREYRADAGSADLNGKQCMIGALQALKRGVQPQQNKEKSYMQALCINGPLTVSELFMSHPPLDKRIAALEQL
ncbi:MAG: protease HtpX [Aeromonadales bacterium]|nr:protease HtpX [Aeromonadales bacterium]